MDKPDRNHYYCWENDPYTTTPTPPIDGKHVFNALWGGNDAGMPSRPVSLRLVSSFTLTP